MFKFIAGLLPAWIWFALAAATLALISSLAWREGGARVQAQWDAAELQREREMGERLREDARIGRQASAVFERWRADQARRQAKVAKELDDALQRHVSCPASGLLADVPVPADVVERLRRAGDDAGGAQPAAGGS